jgi:hypothetical protein
MSDAVILLCLLPEGAEVPADAPAHRRVACAGGLQAIVIGRAPPVGAEEAIELAMTQTAILSAYAEREDVLPVALVSAFSDDRTLAAHVAANMPRIAAERDALTGTAEYVLSIEMSGVPSHAPMPTDTGYLRRRQAEIAARREAETARRAFAAMVVAELGSRAARLGRPRAPNRSSFLTVSALLRRASVAETAAALAALAPEAARLSLGLRMIGPCAPFSFVDGAATDV